MYFRGIHVCKLFSLFFIISICSIAQAKSVYVISNTYGSRLAAYKIEGTSLVYQKDYYCVWQSSEYPTLGAVGLALDESEYGETLFVTNEWYQTVEIVDARTMQYLGELYTYDSNENAGIVADTGRKKVYFMERYTNHLYVYSWDEREKILTGDLLYPYFIELQGTENHSPKGAYGIALDEKYGRLYVSDNTNKIKYYNTSDWSKAGEVNVSCNSISVAIDTEKQLLYYGSMGFYGENDSNLYQYNLSTSIESDVNIGCSVAGISVDQQTSLVYLTTYGDSGDTYYPQPPRDRIMIYDSNLVKQNWESNDVGNPAGICVPSGNAEYKPRHFHFEKVDINEPNSVLPGDYITYRIAYGPNGVDHNDVVITDFLPYEVNYETPLDPNYNAEKHTYTWAIGHLSTGADNNSVNLTVKVNQGADPNGVIINFCKIESDIAYNTATAHTNVGAWQPDSEIIYVNRYSLVSPGTGLSWQLAYRDLQDALDRADDGYGSQIWVAKGTYIPSVPQEYPTFQMVDGVSMYGHFSGDENSIYKRNLTNPASETILSGEGISLWYLVTASGLNQNTNLDGFTITGNSTLIWIEYAKLNIKNCLISGNGNEFGISADHSDFTVADCTIQNVSSNGIYSTNSNFTITDCNIHNNGIGIKVQSSLTGSLITNNIIHNNITAGIAVYDSDSLLVANNLIHHNISDGIYTQSLNITYQNDTIVSNGSYGINDNGTTSGPTIHNCIIWNNTPDLLNTGWNDWYHATYSCFTSYDIAVRGTGNIYGDANDPNFVSADSNNFHLDPNSPCIDKGDPNGNYDNQTDIDGECRVIYGKTALRVDIGADELYHSKVDYDHNNIVNFNDYAIWANYWMTNDSNGFLDDDNDVDINDLAVFCDEWLWIAPWSPLYESLGLGGMGMMTESSSESFVLPEEMLSETVMEEPSESNDQPMSDEQIQELIDWTEQLWESNPELMELAGQDGYDLIMESLTEQLAE